MSDTAQVSPSDLITRAREYLALGIFDLKIWWVELTRALPTKTALFVRLPAARRKLLEILFSVLGRMASVDGRVGNSELGRLEALMRGALGLNDSDRLYVFSVLRLGNQERLTIPQVLQRYRGEFERHPWLARQTYNGLLFVAYADGIVNSIEREALSEALKALNISSAQGAALESRHKQLEKVLKERDRLHERIWLREAKKRTETRQKTHENFNKTHQSKSVGQEKPHSTEADYYSVLGLKCGDSTELIKRNYRKLVRKLHPDRLQSQQLAPEYVKAATAEFRKVQTAYEELMKTRRG